LIGKSLELKSEDELHSSPGRETGEHLPDLGYTVTSTEGPGTSSLLISKDNGIDKSMEMTHLIYLPFSYGSFPLILSKVFSNAT
jgi:hypothetical protein